jgi:hypothetical protein
MGWLAAEPFRVIDISQLSTQKMGELTAIFDG